MKNSKRLDEVDEAVYCNAFVNWVECPDCGKIYQCVYMRNSNDGRLLADHTIDDCYFCGYQRESDEYSSDYHFRSGAFSRYYLVKSAERDLAERHKKLWNIKPLEIGQSYRLTHIP